MSDDAGRATAAVLRHAAAEREGLVSVSLDGDDVVISSAGETSLLVARVPAGGETGLAGTFAAPPGDVPEGGSAELSAGKTGLAAKLGRRKLTLQRLSEAPLDVEWVWPGAPPAVEAVVSRDGLLDVLPTGEGRITFAGADRQLVVQAGREERRLPLKNRPRRRKDIGAAVSFDELRRLVDAAGPDVSVELADLRPLTITSGGVRGVIVRGMPMRWTPPGADAPAPRAKPAARAKARAKPAADDDAASRAATAAEAKARRAAEAELREQERQAAERRRSAADVRRALIRALGQLTTAVEEAEPLEDPKLTSRLERLRDSVAQLNRDLDG